MSACLYCLFTLLQCVSCFASVVFKRVYELCSAKHAGLPSVLNSSLGHVMLIITSDYFIRFIFFPVHCCPNILSLALQVNLLAHSSCSVKICFSDSSLMTLNETSTHGIIAANVNGIPILKKSEFLTVYPSLRRIPIPVIFADAPIGVQLPPRVAPERSPK